MKVLKKHLQQLSAIKRKKLHPLVHKLHKRYHISKKTLFYLKEYGPNANVPRTIIRESIRILILASIISSFGGLALEHIRKVFIMIIPLIILLPTLNDMVGDFGTIVSSKFSTMLHEGKITRKWWIDKDLKKLFLQILIIGIIMSHFTTVIALIIAHLSHYTLDKSIILKVFLVSITDVILLITILFFISVSAGLYFFKKGEDPNNFLIPITTSIADFGNMILLALLTRLLF